MALRLLGAVQVVTPGTPVSVMTNLAQVPAPIHKSCQAIAFQALPTNVGVVYIGYRGMVRATFANVAAVIPAPGSNITGPFITATIALPMSPAGLNAADFYVDANNSSDGVIVSYTEG